MFHFHKQFAFLKMLHLIHIPRCDAKSTFLSLNVEKCLKPRSSFCFACTGPSLLFPTRASSHTSRITPSGNSSSSSKSSPDALRNSKTVRASPKISEGNLVFTEVASGSSWRSLHSISSLGIHQCFKCSTYIHFSSCNFFPSFSLF